ncbi:MAG: methyl-accepting chemotaxis protein [Spirochaetaceae bacterium]|jgi:methyl-accepting chemotaxis protein|nr:methyl-accepting chemotaxis protein [Spirochaetaceae bacterium]
MKLKQSISTVLVSIFLAGILGVTLSVSAVFVIRMRALTTAQIETITREQVGRITDSLIQTFKSYEQALFQASAGIAVLYEYSGEPYLTSQAITEDEMRSFLSRTKSAMNDVAQVFMANNTPTFQNGGYAVFFPAWNFGGDYDQRTRPWYKGAKAKAGAVNYTDPYLALATGVVSTSLSTIIYDRNKTDLGVLVLDISVSSLTQIVHAANKEDGLSTWLLNKEGLYISGSDPSAVMKTDFFADQKLGQYKQNVLGSASFYAMDKERIICSSIIPGAEWAVVSIIPRSAVFAKVNQSIFTTVLLAGAMIVLLTAFLIIAVRRISKPIVTITHAFKDISEGEGDLTRQISVSARNEIGDLAHYFNLTTEKIRTMVAGIKEQASALFDLGNELASNMTESAAAVNEIAANIQSVKNRAVRQSASVSETNATMERITLTITKLSGQVENQTASIARSSAGIEQMIANIQSVTGTLIQNSGNVRELIEASDAGRGGLQEVAADIQEIARESEGLLEINAVMQNIASQTNLLSMNAAIEAAHAGEAGKGFAVVADEIRKLAENSGEQSKTISAVLKKIKTSIDKITASTYNVLDKFESIDRGVKTVADQEENIRGAMEEQGAGSKQILEDIGKVNEITSQVQTASADMLEGSKEVIREGGNLEKSAQEIAGGMNEMASGAEQINAAVNRVNELSSQNRNYIALLVREISKFKIE